MAKLYFKYSTMNAGKSIDLIRTNFNYLENGCKTLCFTSGIDNRYGLGKITSRIGLSIDAIMVYDTTDIFKIVENMEGISCVFVDEVQFLKKEHIFQLCDIVDKLDIPVMCYGLRSDFKLGIFEGSMYLMGLSDSIEEIKTICVHCKEKKAIVNSMFIDGKVVNYGETIQIGGNDTYKPLCRKCYNELRLL